LIDGLDGDGAVASAGLRPSQQPEPRQRDQQTQAEHLPRVDGRQDHQRDRHECQRDLQYAVRPRWLRDHDKCHVSGTPYEIWLNIGARSIIFIDAGMSSKQAVDHSPR